MASKIKGKLDALHKEISEIKEKTKIKEDEIDEMEKRAVAVRASKSDNK